MTATTDRTVRLERIIPASPHEVYRAWLGPDVLKRWMAPGPLAVTHVEVDERVGGHFRIWHGADGSEAGGFECGILELVPDQRLVFRWGFVGPERTNGPVFDSRLTITLAEAADNGTALSLVHEQMDELYEAMPQVAENVGGGWEDVLTKLASLSD